MRDYRPQRTPDDLVNRNLDGIAAVLADLQALPASLGVAAGAAGTYVDTATITQASFMAIFTGGAGKTLTLPGAAALGMAVCQILFVRNDSASSVTMAPADGDSIVGSATVAATTTAVYVSDGGKRWLRAV